MSLLIALKRPGRVVLASDSLYQRRIDGRVDTIKRQKIREVHSATTGFWWVAVGGYLTHPGARHDAYDHVGRALRGLDTIDMATALQAVHERLKKPLNEGLHALAQSGGEPLCQVAIARLDADGQPVLGIYHRRHQVTIIARVFGPADSFSDVASVEALGSALDLLRRQRQEAWVLRCDLGTVRRLIAAQARATPGLIGPPYDALVLTAAGEQWHHGLDIEEAAA